MPLHICIDPGHGGHDPGAVQQSKPATREKDITLLVSNRIDELLRADGFKVTMTRNTDRFVSLLDRANKSAGVDMFVSIHCNAAIDTNATGMEVWVSQFKADTGDSELAAMVLASMLDTHPGHKDRGVRKGNFYVLTRSSTTAVLVELEFLSNYQQAAFLRDNVESLARAVVRGVQAYVQKRITS